MSGRVYPADMSMRKPTVEETSAGGLVLDRSGAVARAALIARHDRKGHLVWSMPKGHLESGETAEEAAVREVHEETGIESHVIGTLGTIDFWFMSLDRRVHKTVHHYLLEADGGELSDADAEVVEVAWFPIHDVAGLLRYPDERRLVNMSRLVNLVPGLLLPAER